MPSDVLPPNESKLKKIWMMEDFDKTCLELVTLSFRNSNDAQLEQGRTVEIRVTEIKNLGP